MASTMPFSFRFSYRRLKQEGGDAVEKKAAWRLRSSSGSFRLRKRLRIKIPRLTAMRRLLRKKARVVVAACARTAKRLKESLTATPPTLAVSLVSLSAQSSSPPPAASHHENLESSPSSATLLQATTSSRVKMTEEELEVNDSAGEDGIENDVKVEKRKNKRKQRLMEEAAKAGKRGICYLSRVPPHMNPVKLRQLLSQYGEIQRIYLVPEDPAAQMNRKRAGGFRGQEFSEGWVEFTKKSIAKRVAKMLNGQQIGGRKRSSFYYDIWNIKYLSKFKWDDLTEEIAYNNAVREQKLALEVSVAKKERDFFLTQVDKSRALSAIEERLKKKQKVQQESVETSSSVDNQLIPKLIRQVPQKKVVAAGTGESKTKLSKDTLAAKQKVQQESVETSSSVDNQLMPKLIRQVPQKKAVAVAAAGTGESKSKLRIH
nr:pre-rRNA-processing protein ESF2 [Ipomoea trifida]